MKVGIMGCGGIAEVMAQTLNQMPEVECYAVASRSIDKAVKFQEKYHFNKAYGSYEELVNDGEVELVYIATPHSHHYENMLMCIAAKKAILCEKAFCVNTSQATEVLALAKKENVLVAEAIWTRYMPSRNQVIELIESGIIGRVSMVSANLCYPIQHIDRIVNPQLAGGSLLDVGVYPINFAAMVLGYDIKQIFAHATYTPTKVDKAVTMTFVYEDDRVASLYCGMEGISDRAGCITGEKGYIQVTNINNISKIEVFSLEAQCIKSIDVNHAISGYEYQVLACKEALSHGRIECPQMPHKEIIQITEIMDEIRRQINVVYEWDK